MIRKYRLGSLSSDNNTGWRSYQDTLKRNTRRHRRGKPPRLRWMLALAVIFVLCAGYGASVTGIWPDSNTSARSMEADVATPPRPLTKQALRRMLANVGTNRLATDTFPLKDGSNRYQVNTTIDPHLQKALTDKLRLEYARYLGIVVMDPSTGHILAMINHDRIHPGRNICADNHFPAASIFKIITASAAIEICHLGPDSTLKYNGRKHTLYKKQLKEQQNKYTNRVTLQDAFAQSINPVFGKLGANRLGGKNLLSYASAFGFNREFNLDFQTAPSLFSVSDRPYRWAELACGFNKETTLSPLHGAMIAATVINGGRLIEPTLIDSVVNNSGQVVYQGHSRTIQNPIKPRTARILAGLMQTTIREGTARKVFRGYRRDRILSRLDLGGKTGSMNNNPRYDWFVGFARDNTSGQSVVVAAMVAHQDFIGIKSGQYARMAIKAYFKEYFARQSAPQTSTSHNMQGQYLKTIPKKG
ncbi:MAG: PbpA [Deltaproteobacteria bacterium]|nr:MAG: PbpA [Deltaproteobacteria bacterium]